MKVAKTGPKSNLTDTLELFQPIFPLSHQYLTNKLSKSRLYSKFESPTSSQNLNLWILLYKDFFPYGAHRNMCLVMDELGGSNSKLNSKVGRYLVITKCLDVILPLVVEIILQKS